MSIVHKQPYLQNFFSNVPSTALQSINTALNSASHSTSFILRKDNLATAMANVNVLAVRFKDNEIFNDYVDAWILKSSNAYCLIVAVNDLSIEVYKIEGSSNSALYLAKVVENISILEVRDAMSTASSIAAAKIVITLTGTSGTLTAAQFADVTDDTKNVILLLNGYYYYLSDKQSDASYLTFVNANYVTNEAIAHKAIVINKDSTSASYKTWAYEEVPSSGGGTTYYEHLLRIAIPGVTGVCWMRVILPTSTKFTAETFAEFWNTSYLAYGLALTGPTFSGHFQNGMAFGATIHYDITTHETTWEWIDQAVVEFKSDVVSEITLNAN